MKKIIVMLAVILLAAGCTPKEAEEKLESGEEVKVEEAAAEKSQYINETYGFSLTVPATWAPIDEQDTGPYEAQNAVSTFWLVGAQTEVIQMSLQYLSLRSMRIAVIPHENKIEFEDNYIPLYHEKLGENDDYEFLYYADLLTMYPYVCNVTHSTEEEKLCASYEPVFIETQEIIDSFEPL